MRVIKNDIVQELFSKYYNPMLLYTISLCKNKVLAEEIVSTAFFKALQTADETVRDFKAWLFTVCRNEYYSICRNKKYLSRLPMDDTVFDPCDDLLDGIIRQEEYRSLYRCVSLLQEDQKEAVLLFYFSAMSISEISVITQKSVSNVMVILHRARENLKKLMEVTQ